MGLTLSEIAVGISIVSLILCLIANCAAYYNGVNDGYGYAREPENPGYRKAGAYIKQQWRFR